MRIKKLVETKVQKEIAIKVVCDICGKELILPEDRESNEYWIAKMKLDDWIFIYKSFGYYSEIGDEETISMDICESCFIEKIGINVIKKCCEES